MKACDCPWSQGAPNEEHAHARAVASLGTEQKHCSLGTEQKVLCCQVARAGCRTARCSASRSCTTEAPGGTRNTPHHPWRTRSPKPPMKYRRRKRARREQGTQTVEGPRHARGAEAPIALCTSPSPLPPPHTRQPPPHTSTRSLQQSGHASLYSHTWCRARARNYRQDKLTDNARGRSTASCHASLPRLHSALHHAEQERQVHRQQRATRVR